MGKTTDRNKLEAFAIVAEERGMPDLAASARVRLSMIHGEAMPDFSRQTSGDSSLSKRSGNGLKRRMDI